MPTTDPTKQPFHQHPKPSEEAPKTLKRVLRPLRPINYIPTKELIYDVPGPDSKLQFVYGRIELPVDPDHLVIRVKAAALNPLDIKIKSSQSMWTYAGEKGIGRDYCGEIIEVGSNLKGKYRTGEHVCGIYMKLGSGTIRSHIIVNPKVDKFTSQPENVSYMEAAAWPLTFGAAYQSLSYLDFKKLIYSNVLILGGATSVGLMAIQLAKKHWKADNVVVTCSNKGEKLCTSLGADKCINYRLIEGQNPQLVNYVEKEVINHKKFDLILDCIGGSSIFSICDKILEPSKNGSAFVTLVGDSKSTPDAIGGTSAYLYQPNMLGRKLFGGLWGMRYIVHDVTSGDWLDLGAKLIKDGTIKVVIDSEYDWLDFQKAIDKLLTARAKGKIVLKIEDFA